MMSEYTIQIDDAAITEQINEILNKILNRELRGRYTSTDREICASIKELIYSRKDEIIEMVVDRAAREIVKKGLPKLLERMG